ncbi:MAG: glycoside hydrolase family 16 protein [SAR324 cluster bacterium]|nr:glycoside hydrolase family 16 protein [SAR324 cluster bacterium]
MKHIPNRSISLLIVRLSLFVLWLAGIQVFLAACQEDQKKTSLERGNVLFYDQFDSLGETRWNISQQSFDSGTGATGTDFTNLLTSHVVEDNDACFTASNTDVSSIPSQLRMSVASQTLNCPDTDNVYQFSGGELRSAANFIFGRFSTKLQTSLKAGAMTSFYLYANELEIGIHFPGNDPTIVALSYRNGTVEEITPLNPNDHSQISNFNAGNRFHTYSILWQKDLIQWSIDGHAVLGIKNNVPENSMNLILSTWVNGDSSQAGIADSNLSAFTDFAFVKVESFP